MILNRDRSSCNRDPVRDWLVREVLKEAGDAAVIKPVAARKAVLSAVRKLRTAARA